MRFLAEINIMPKKEILDPQGKAVRLGLENLGVKQIDDVRIGKHITLELDVDTEEKAKIIVEEACKKLLANLIMESFNYKISLLV